MEDQCVSQSQSPSSKRKVRRIWRWLLLGLVLIVPWAIVTALRKPTFLPRGVEAIPGAQQVLPMTGPLWASNHEVITFLGGLLNLLDTINGVKTPVRAFTG